MEGGSEDEAIAKRKGVQAAWKGRTDMRGNEEKRDVQTYRGK
jgi:hypothetical protein